MLEIAAAFFAGLASFLSPCILPIIPGFISAMANSAADCTTDKRSRTVMFLSASYFVLGLATVFALISTIIACFCNNNALVGLALKHYIAYTGGTVMVILGSFLLLSYKFPRFNFQKMIPLSRIRSTFHTSYIVAFVFGATFAAGWDPCVGVFLASVLTLAVTHPQIAYDELLAYALGIGLPLILVSLFFADFNKLYLVKRLSGYMKHFNIIVGGLMLIVGILFIINLSSPLY